MAADIYLKVEGTELQGDSTDSDHPNEIELLSVYQDISQPKSSTSSTAGGHTAERADFGDVICTKHMDRPSAKLNVACAAGTVYSKITIKCYRAFGGQASTSSSKTRINYWTIIGDNAIVSDSEITIAESALPIHKFALRCSKYTYEYKQHKIDGTSSSTGVIGWDLAKNVRV